MNLLRNTYFPPEGLPGAGLQHKAETAPLKADATQAKVLIVTNFPDRFAAILAHAVMVRTCKDAMYEIQKGHFKAVFCDFGPLGPEENGLRFAFELRSKGIQASLFLMADDITLEDESQAMHQGAKGLIGRSSEGLTAALRQQYDAFANPFKPLGPGFSSAKEQRPLIPLEALDRIKTQMRKYIGPVADDLVFKTLASIGKRYPTGVPYHALVHAVANYIESPNERDRFLTDLGV